MGSSAEPYVRRPRNLDFAGFAQEFLRRNPDYAADYAKMTERTERGAPTSAREVMASRWGLGFPVRAGHSRIGRAGDLGCHGLGLRSHPRYCALRHRQYLGARPRTVADHSRRSPSE